jgi:hypothetical protein
VIVRGSSQACLASPTIVKQISLKVFMTQDSERLVPYSVVQLELCRLVFLFGYIALQWVTDIKGSRAGFLGRHPVQIA